MRLRLIREPSIAGATFGVLFVDDVFECFTLEDQIREIAGVDVAQWKVPQQTAIPAGTYPVRITMSSRFKRLLPLIDGVAGFSGIRIHAGNAIEDTEGCPLVGRRRSGRRLVESRLALEPLFEKLQRSSTLGEPIVIAVENPPSWAR
jgi:hypothetical protein